VAIVRTPDSTVVRFPASHDAAWEDALSSFEDEHALKTKAATRIGITFRNFFMWSLSHQRDLAGL
jgi:hypothetical protein